MSARAGTVGVCARCRGEAAARAHELDPPGRATPRLTDCLCRHHCAYPERVRRDPLAPSILHIDARHGSAARLRRLLAAKVVAVVGAARPSEYGTEIARALAGALAARGVTVAAEIAPGIALAAHEGSLRAGGAPLALVAEDLERRSPAWCGPLYREILERGCALSALQADGCVGKAPRPGTASVLAPLADLVVLVEASARGPELAYARACRKCGVALAAVPGRVDAPTSHGTNTLIAAGAPVLCGVQDALDAIYSPNADRADRTPQAERARRAPRRRDAGRTGALAPSRTSAPTAGPVALDLEHSRLLERVVLGADTLDALCAEGEFEPEALELGLTELELLGVLRRGVGGRYLPCAEVAIG